MTGSVRTDSTLLYHCSALHFACVASTLQTFFCFKLFHNLFALSSYYKYHIKFTIYVLYRHVTSIIIYSQFIVRLQVSLYIHNLSSGYKYYYKFTIYRHITSIIINSQFMCFIIMLQVLLLKGVFDISSACHFPLIQHEKMDIM